MAAPAAWTRALPTAAHSDGRATGTCLRGACGFEVGTAVGAWSKDTSVLHGLRAAVPAAALGSLARVVDADPPGSLNCEAGRDSMNSRPVRGMWSHTSFSVTVVFLVVGGEECVVGEAANRQGVFGPSCKLALRRARADESSPCHPCGHQTSNTAPCPTHLSSVPWSISP